MSTAQPETIAEEIFVGGGEMGALMRSHDWSQTPLGAVQDWSQNLKTAVRIMLTSRQAMFVWWGKDLINLYNDAYRMILGGKHPKSLGQPASLVWQEIWDQVRPRAESAIYGNEGTYDEALLLIMERNGYPEETYYTFSYSPVPDANGKPGGIICANTEETQRIIGERQLTLLKELASKTADARTFEEACTFSAACLATNAYDLPFGMIYLVDPNQQRAVLAGTSGIEPGHAFAPQSIELDDEYWHFAAVASTHEPYLISNLDARSNDLPTGAWTRSPNQLAIIPIAPSGETGKAGVLVVGLNPFRLFDANYQRFLNLVAAQIAASIATAQAYEEERNRAEALAELDRAKTTFFSNVSHEFRTPLTLMLSPLEEMLAADGVMPPEQHQQLELIHRNALRLLKLVNTLLDFSRLEAGRVQAVYEPIDLAAFTAELASVFRSAIEQAGLQFVVTCEALSEAVYVDRSMWEKIVLNLLSNAFKFTFSGAIAVTLRQAQNQIELAVSDTGIGISTAELPRLFERFHRVEGAQGRTQEGSGIGLALVQELVQLHGGQVQVKSCEGEGTTFSVTLPLGTAHLPSDRTEPNQPLASTAIGAAPYVQEALRWLPDEESGAWGFDVRTQPNRGGQAVTASSPIPDSRLPTPNPRLPTPASSARILLVDDNTDMRSYVKRLLLNQGYEVETAVDGIAALAMVQQQLPDLVLTDVMMPRLDGFGLLWALRTVPKTRELPIILLSARAGEEARVEGLEAGADDYLIKPFSARELLARVEGSLKLAQLRRDAQQREQALRLEAETAKENTETILASINDGFYVLDRDWRYTYVNDRLCEMAGMQREAMLGQSIWELFPDTVDTEVYMQFQQAMTEQRPSQFENFYGAWNRWYEHRIYPSSDGTTVFVAEITDRKQAEASLQRLSTEIEQQLQKFDAVMSSVPDFIYTFDLSGRFTYINQPLLDLWQKTLAEAVGKNFFELDYPTELAERLQHQIQHVISTRQPLKDETPYLSAAGERAYEYILVPLLSIDGTVVAVAGTTRDITDRKKVEAELRQKNAILDVINESAPTPIFVKNRQGQMIYANPATLRVLGKSLAEVIGYRNCDLYPNAEDAVKITENDRRIMESGEMEVVEESPDGIRTFLGMKVPYRNEAGEIIGLIGISNDITDRVQIERDRERVLQQEQAAREEAERANRIKDEFLAVLSHELRSPLNPILGWSRLLQDGKLDQATTAQALAAIDRNARLQSELIEDLLDISRILQGKLSLNVAAVDLAATTQAAMETVQLAAAAKAIHLQHTFDPEVGLVSGDPARLQQVVWNLLSNAVKFTPDGGQVEIRLEQHGTQAQLTVSDTGRGIPAAFLPHVFDYFRQADATTTRQFGGLGLGLAIVHHLVELHGGNAWAESPGEGQGATFTVSLPVLPNSPRVKQPHTASESDVDLSAVHILIVDDDTDTREIVAFLLKQAGAAVTVATTASEAFAAILRSTPDLLISDIGMPETDGYMLIHRIRALKADQGGQLPAIALTAYAGALNRQKALKAGFQQHLAKPIEPDKLIKAVATLLEHRHSAS